MSQRSRKLKVGGGTPLPAVDEGAKRAARLRATTILEGLDESAHKFIGRWIGFNAAYNAYVDIRQERDRAMECIRESITDAEATQILLSTSGDVSFLTYLPPGDMRYRPDDPRFRARGCSDMDSVNDANLAASKRLAYLVAVVYQVRCNLVHGDKDAQDRRGRKLIRASDNILRQIIAILTEA